jgi:serine/threonine-protein kinase HipA
MQIFFENRKVAALIPSDVGPSLIYDPEWLSLSGAFAVSTRMPLREAAYGAAIVLPWIVNLLPEEDNLEAILRLTGVAKADALGILAEIGRDTSGALSFAEQGTPRMQCRAVETTDKLERIINELPKKPFLAGDEGVSMSLAGVQTKIGVHIDDQGQICIPINGSPSTWILKPDTDRLWGSVYNEAFCMRLALNSGLNAPAIRIGRAGARTFLLIERYDRIREGDVWRRIHQEDMCQALGHFPATKYEFNKAGRRGPRLRDIVGVLREHSGIPAVLSFLRYAIFNILVCNTDAHAKNYSILIRSDGTVLTPIYDVMCAAVWPNVTKSLATSVATKRDGDHLMGRHWQREALLCALGASALIRLVTTLCNNVEKQLDRTFDEIVGMDVAAQAMAGCCREDIRARIGHIRAGLKETETNPAAWVETKRAKT